MFELVLEVCVNGVVLGFIDIDFCGLLLFGFLDIVISSFNLFDIVGVVMLIGYVLMME